MVIVTGINLAENNWKVYNKNVIYVRKKDKRNK